MRKIITAIFIAFFVLLQMVHAETNDDFWKSYKEILANTVSVDWYTTIDGGFSHSSVDYKKLKNDHEILKKVIDQNNKLEFAKVPEEAKHNLAFWINAYNFFTIFDVVEKYPVASMKKIGWKSKHHIVGKEMYSLDDIEHYILRPLKDPRIHFAINCASVGCPGLSTEVYDGDKIDEQLDRAASNALINPLHLQMVSKDEVHTTQIFNWFGNDFDIPQYKGIGGFIYKYAPKRLRSAHKIVPKLKYDWNLNTKANINKRFKEISEKFPKLNLMGNKD